MTMLFPMNKFEFVCERVSMRREECASKRVTAGKQQEERIGRRAAGSNEQSTKGRLYFFHSPARLSSCFQSRAYASRRMMPFLFNHTHTHKLRQDSTILQTPTLERRKEGIARRHQDSRVSAGKVLATHVPRFALTLNSRIGCRQSTSRVSLTASVGG